MLDRLEAKEAQKSSRIGAFCAVLFSPQLIVQKGLRHKFVVETGTHMVASWRDGILGSAG
jgi:hypothetical protein